VLDAEQRWWRAVSRGDVDHALNKFSSDTVFETPDGAMLRGRVALGEHLRRDGRDRLEVLGTPEHVHVDSPELVVVTGTGQWTAMTAEARGPTTIRYIDTWRWNGSAWRLVSAATGPVSESSAGTKLVRQVLAAWSTGDWAGLQPLLAPGYRAKSAGNGGSELRKRFDTFHRNWTRARFDIEEQFAVGERIVTRIAATLTEAGTGKTLRYSGLDVSRVVDGQLTDHWDSWEEMRGQPAPPAPSDEGPTGAAPAAANAPDAASATSAANDLPQAISVEDAAAPAQPGQQARIAEPATAARPVAEPGQPAPLAQPPPAHGTDAAVQ
jgi:ketosteroid isomerase-like protein